MFPHTPPRLSAQESTLPIAIIPIPSNNPSPSPNSGFKVMVNEHSRVMIPHIFLTANQLTAAERTWMHGVRVRWDRGVPLLGGGKPNRGWLGPEVS